MDKKEAKNLLDILNKITTLEDLAVEKEKCEKIIKNDLKKPFIIEVEYLGCYEELRDGTKTIHYLDAMDFVNKENISNNIVKTYVEAKEALDAYAENENEDEDECVPTYTIEEIQRNSIGDLVDYYWENIETTKFRVRKKRG